ncbi:MAG: hypothetical protein ACODAJ_04495 [Planctomycetota bacterium]
MPDHDVPFEPATLTLRQKLKLLWGRPRRLFLGLFRPGYVRASHARRRGECRRCGACCQLAIRCPHMIYEDGLGGCDKYDRRRPLNCQTFPIDERDLADRDLLAPHCPCGYHFVPADADEAESSADGPPRES